MTSPNEAQGLADLAGRGRVGRFFDRLERMLGHWMTQTLCAAWFLTAICDRLNLGLFTYLAGFVAWMALTPIPRALSQEPSK